MRGTKAPAFQAAGYNLQAAWGEAQSCDFSSLTFLQGVGAQLGSLRGSRGSIYCLWSGRNGGLGGQL